MQWFDRFMNLMRPKPEGQRVYVPRRQGGVTVTEDTAHTYSWVAACIRLRSCTMAAMPWQVYRKLASGREAMPQNVVQWLLNVQPNPEQTAFVLRRTLMSNFDTWGNGYAEIERGMDGRPVWLWHLPPDSTCLERSETGELYVKARVNGGEYVLPRNNVFHLSDGSRDGLTGVSRIQLARRTIGAGIAGDQMTASIFENGGGAGGVVKQGPGKALSPEAREVLLKSFDEKYGGPSNAGKTKFLENGWEYQDIKSMPLVDLEFILNRRFQGEEVCRWFDTPLHLVQDTSQANYAVSYEATKNFVEHTLRPLAVLMEQEANIRLFGMRSQGAVYSRMNLAGLLRADPATRGEYYRALINAGVMSINEVRELEELNSIGSDGNEHYIQLNMTTVKRVAEGENMPKEAPPAPPPVPAEPQPVNVTVEGSTINVAPPEVHVAAPTVNVASPAVNVAPPEVTVEAPNVTVNNVPDDVPRETIITERDPVTNLATRSVTQRFSPIQPEPRKPSEKVVAMLSRKVV
jgi:HK97 family phage portal protein